MQELSRSELLYLIDEWIFKKRDRDIMESRLLDGLTYDELSELYFLSPQRIKVIVKKNKETLIKHM